MTDVTEKAVEAAADVAAEVAQHAEGAEQVIRSLNQVKLSYAGLGLVVGVAAGAVGGYLFAFRRAETKFSLIAAEEIAEARENYYAKAVALESEASKGDLEAIVQERGYSAPASSEPPMAVTAPEAVVEAAKELAEEEKVEDIPEVAEPEPEVRNVFREAAVEDTWDWHVERRNRSPLKPYVVHIDERDDNTAYDSVTYTYYEADDVLCNERDEVVGVDERDALIGEANLEKFGHGSNDATVVYIRNDRLEMDMEVIRSPNSYAEEVHGFDPPEIRHSHRRGRPTFDDD